MSNLKNQFTAEVCQLVLANIEQGCFPEAAASAAGVSRKALMEWLNDPRPKYRTFQLAYEEAVGKARSHAEKAVFKDDPKFWLRYGPGRERYNTSGELVPGWGESVHKPVEAPQSSTVVNVIAHPAFQAIQKVLADVLANDPEKRAQIAQKLAAIEGEKK